MAKDPKAQTPPNPDDDGDGGGDSPQYITSEQFNATITAKLNDFANKKLPKLLEGALAPILAKLAEVPAPESKAQGGESNAELEKLRQEAKATKDALAKLQDERQREVAQAKKDRARSLLTASLTGAGVTHPRLVEAAAKLLEDAIGEADDGSGKIVFRRNTAYGTTEEVTVDEAVKAWAKTEDGKPFVTGRPVKGSNSNPTAPPSSRPNPPPRGKGGSDDEAKAARAAEERQAKRVLAESLGLMPPSAE